MSLFELRDKLLEVDTEKNIPVFHIEPTGDNARYILWTEEGEGTATYGSNKMLSQSIEGTIDFYTKVELDPDFEFIQEKLEELMIGWQLLSIQHEEDTGYHHYEWSFEVY